MTWKLCKRTSKKILINSTLSSVAGNIALGCGRQLEAANTTLITAKHIEFEKEPDKEPAKEPVKEPEQESCKEADKEPVKILHILYTWFRNRMHLLRHLPIRLKFKSPFCQKNLRQDQQKTLGEFRLAKSYPNKIAWHVRQKRTKDRQKPPLMKKGAREPKRRSQRLFAFLALEAWLSPHCAFINRRTRRPASLILGDPGAVSRTERKGATKVFKHRQKSPWVPSLTGQFNFQTVKQMLAPDWARSISKYCLPTN